MAGSQLLVLTTVGGAAVAGVLGALLPAVEPALARRAGGGGRVPGLRPAFGLALAAALFLGGMGVDARGPQEGLIFGCLLASVGTTLLALARRRHAVLGAAAVAGAGLALAYLSAAAVMPAALFPDHPTAALGLGHLALGGAALLATAVLPWLDAKRWLRQGLLMLALLCLVPAAAAGLVNGDEFPGAPVGQAPLVLGDPRLWLAGLALMLYLPLEATVASWAPAYLTELGHSPGRLPAILAGFWIAFLTGRVLAVVSPELMLPWLAVVLLVLAGATVGNLVGLNGRLGGMLGVWLFGACLGPALPALAGLVLRGFPTHFAFALGAASAVGAAGGLVLLPGVETVARGSWRGAMRLVMVLALAAAAPTVVLCLLV